LRLEFVSKLKLAVLDKRKPNATNSLHQNGITLATKNCQGNDPWRLAAKQNPPRIESQGNLIFLAASR